MKRLLFATFCLACLSVTAVHAQKGKTTLRDSLATGGNPSAIREGRNVGKGTPILQRQSGGGGSEKASEMPAESAPAPSAPAPAEKKNDQKNVAPANHTGAKPKD